MNEETKSRVPDDCCFENSKWRPYAWVQGDDEYECKNCQKTFPHHPKSLSGALWGVSTALEELWESFWK